MPKKILLVDDDEDFRSLLALSLRQYEFDVITAANGEEALHLISRNVPDLMIVDLTMPVMTGWHFNIRVREDARYMSTPIIFLSGLLGNETAPEESDPNTFYVPKPFDILQLVQTIKRLLAPPGTAEFNG